MYVPSIAPDDNDNFVFFFLLIRLSKWRPVMAKKLFACDGNLFDFKVDDSLLTFSNAPSEAVRAANLEVSINAQFPVDYDGKALRYETYLNFEPQPLHYSI